MEDDVQDMALDDLENFEPAALDLNDTYDSEEEVKRQEKEDQEEEEEPFHYDVEEICVWKDQLTAIQDSLPAPAKAATGKLLDEVVKKIKILAEEPITVAFIGLAGQGKSEIINQLAAPPEWLERHEFTQKKFGKIPLVSGYGGDHLTQNWSQLKWSDHFGVTLHLETDLKIFQERMETLKLKDLTPPHEEKKEILPSSPRNLFSNVVEVLDRLSETLSAEEKVALKYVEVSGPWGFPKDLILFDTPGFGSNDVQDKYFEKMISGCDAIAWVGARCPKKEEIKQMISKGAFRDLNKNRVLVAFYFKQGKVNISFNAKRGDVEEWDKDLKETTKSLKNALMESVSDVTVQIPKEFQSNILKRKNFFGKIARGSIAFQRNTFEDAQKRKSLVEQIRKSAHHSAAEDALNTVAAWLLTTKRLLDNRGEPKGWKNTLKSVKKKKISTKLDPNDLVKSIEHLISDEALFVDKSMNSSSLMIACEDHFIRNILPPYQNYLRQFFSVYTKSQAEADESDLFELSLLSSWKRITSSSEEKIREKMKKHEESLKQKIKTFKEENKKALEELTKIDADLDASLAGDFEDLIRSELRNTFISLLGIAEEIQRKTFQEMRDLVVGKPLNSKDIQDIQNIQKEIVGKIAELNENLNKWRNKKPTNNKTLPELTAKDRILFELPWDNLLEELDEIKEIKKIKEGKKSREGKTPPPFKPSLLKTLLDRAPWSPLRSKTIPIIETKVKKTDKNYELTFHLGKSICDFISEFSSKVLSQTSEQYIYPIFCVSWVKNQACMKNLNLTFDGLDGVKSLIFIVTEPSQSKMYQEFLQKAEPKVPTFILQLPNDHPLPAFTMDIIKLFAETFKFPCIFDIDHQLKGKREFNKILIRSNRCTTARAAIGMQQLLSDVQNHIKKKVFEEIVAKGKEILYQPNMKPEEQGKIFDFWERVKDEKTASVDLPEITEIISSFKDEELKKSFQDIISQARSIGMIFTVPMQYQRADCISFYPKLARLYRSWESSPNKKNKPAADEMEIDSTKESEMEVELGGNKEQKKEKRVRKIEGIVLWNLAALNEFYFSKHQHFNPLQTQKKKTMVAFQDSYIAAKKTMLRKMWEVYGKVTALVRLWGYSVQREKDIESDDEEEEVEEEVVEIEAPKKRKYTKKTDKEKKGGTKKSPDVKKNLKKPKVATMEDD